MGGPIHRHEVETSKMIRKSDSFLLLLAPLKEARAQLRRPGHALWKRANALVNDVRSTLVQLVNIGIGSCHRKADLVFFMRNCYCAKLHIVSGRAFG
jgi:hypothetical protein